MRATPLLIVLFLALSLAPLGSLLHPPSLESQPSPQLDARDMGRRVDLNTADAPSLCLLPGVGPPMAVRIIEYRAKSPFVDVGDLRHISGVGESILSRTAPYVVVARTAAK